jgi:two-component system nitrate/nitrite response regulator NarL
MLNIILADDHELIREAVRPYLLSLADEVSVWEASTYTEVYALESRAQRSPEGVSLALIDLRMPGLSTDDPYEGLRRILQIFPKTSVAIFSGDEDGAVISGALKIGARGYITKTTRGASLVNALNLIIAGEIYVPPTLADKFPDIQPPLPSSKILSTAKLVPTLTPSEIEGLNLLAQGRTNKEIARELGIPGDTLKMHLSSAYRKLGATNRVEAVRIATKLNLT